MDEAEELAKFKWILGAFVLFLCTGIYSYYELKYAIWGATAQATVTRTFETKGTGRRAQPLLAVEYTFTDSKAGQLSERDDVSIDWPVPERTVTVQYLPGVPDSSRLQGNSNNVAVWIFVVSVAVLGFCAFRAYKTASEAVRGMSR